MNKIASLFIISFIFFVAIGFLFRNTWKNSFLTTNNQPQAIYFIRDGDLWYLNKDTSNINQITDLGGIEEYWVFESGAVVIKRINYESHRLVAELLYSQDSLKTFEVVVNKTFEFSNRPDDIYPHFEFKVSVAPDGNSLVYGGDFSDSLQLYDLQKKSTIDLQHKSIFEFALSRDGKRLAFIKDANIEVLDLPTGDQLAKTEFIRGNVSYESFMNPQKLVGWTADGLSVIYLHGNYGQGMPVSKSVQHLYAFDIPNNLVHKLSKSEEGLIDNPTSDLSMGGYLYYVTSKANFQKSAWRLNLDNYEIVEVPDLINMQVVLNSGQGLIFSKRGFENNSHEIWKSDLLGKNAQILIENGTISK